MCIKAILPLYYNFHIRHSNYTIATVIISECFSDLNKNV